MSLRAINVGDLVSLKRNGILIEGVVDDYAHDDWIEVVSREGGRETSTWVDASAVDALTVWPSASETATLRLIPVLARLGYTASAARPVILAAVEAGTAWGLDDLPHAVCEAVEAALPRSRAWDDAAHDGETWELGGMESDADWSRVGDGVPFLCVG